MRYSTRLLPAFSLALLFSGGQAFADAFPPTDPGSRTVDPAPSTSASSTPNLGTSNPGALAEPGPDAGQSEDVQGEDKAERLDSLFSKLKRESDPEAAKRLAANIWQEWRHSGSSTVDLLMLWASKAIAAKHYATALDFLDQAIALEPDFAESWNQRATLHYMMDDYAKSMSDIDHVLALEPRHFGALSGMAGIFMTIGKDKLALRAFERVLKVYPANREAQEQVGKLADKLAGDSI